MSFLEDTFVGADGTLLTAHTGESGVTWSSHPAAAGNCTINANRIRSSTSGIVVASDIADVDDYMITATLHTMPTIGSTDLGIAFDIHATANTFYLARHASGSGWQLYKFVNGSATALGSTPATLSVSTDYVMRVERRNGSQRLYVNGVMVASATDVSLPFTGRIGFRSSGTDLVNDGQHIDSIIAEAIPSGVVSIPSQRTRSSMRAKRVRLIAALIGGGAI